MLLSAISWCAIIGWAWLIFAHGRFWRVTLPQQPLMIPEQWPNVAVIIPARDEAAMLPTTLPALLANDYPGQWQVVLVDDHSSDGTREIAQRLAEAQPEGRLKIISPPPLPAGWSGKVHAMYCGVEASENPAYILFTDADILHQQGTLRFLVARALDTHLDLHSLMVRLHCKYAWEKLLIPAFVYFFQMLYPFTWSNSPSRATAAAAGGVMLVRNQALQEIGGIASIKDAIIDDCALASAIKSRGRIRNGQRGRTLLTLADREAMSLREYPDLASLWQMIRRSAFTQLRYSVILLIAAIIGMFLLFIAPIAMSLSGNIHALAGWLVFVAMIYSYLPMVEFYRLNILWSATLPFAALVYMGATLDSAWQYWRGSGGAWKGRTQASKAMP